MPWTTENARDGLVLVPFVRIDGYPLRIFTRVPTGWVADAWTNVDGLDVPGAIAQSLSQGSVRTSVENLKIVISDLPLTGALAPYRFSRLFGATSRMLADSTVWTAGLTVELEPVDTTVTVSNTLNMPARPFYAHVGNECIEVQDPPVGSTFPCARNRFPCGGGAVAWGMWHRVDTDAPWQYPVSTVPYNWFNRRIALYFTWVDPNGNFGPAAEIHRRWIGRIKGVRFAGNDKWELDCAAITQDVERPILAPTTATTHLQMGLELRGLSAVDRQIDIAIFEPAGTFRRYVGVVAANRYSTIDDFLDAVESAASTVMVEATDGYLYLSREPDENGNDHIVLLWDWTGTLARDATFRFSQILAIILGLESNDSSGIASVSYTWDFLGFNARPEPVTAPAPRAVFYWGRHCSRVAVTGTTGFTTGTLNDLSNPTIEIMGRAVRRYSSLAGNDFVTVSSPIQDNTFAHYGDGHLVIRDGEPRSGSVHQVYLMPRSWGVRRVTDWGVPANILRLLTSTGSGSNGAWDQYPKEYGLGIPIDYIDVASFEAVTEYMPSVLERRWCLREGAVVAKVIDAECQVLGLYLVMDGSGRIALRIARDPLPGAAAVALTEYNKMETPGRSAWALPASTIRNAGTLRYGYPIAGEGEPEYEMNFGTPQSLSMFGEQRGGNIDHHGLDDFGDGAIENILDALAAQFARTSFPQATITRTISRDVFTRLVPGDIVLLTDSAVPNQDTGDRGLSSVPHRVQSVSEDIHGARGEVTLMRDSIVPSNARTPVCPSARVTAAAVIGAGPNWRLTLGANEFTNAADGTDVIAFNNGDVLLIEAGDAANPAAAVSVTRTIVAIGPGANQIDIDGDLGALTPATNVVYLTFARHITAAPPAAVAGQLPRGTWFAGTDGVILNSTTYRAHLYD